VEAKSAERWKLTALFRRHMFWMDYLVLNMRRRAIGNALMELTMLDGANYSAMETLRDLRRLEIRALKPDDQINLLSAVDRIGPVSLYRRFFTVKRNFTDRERAFFLNVDFDKHVALLALVEEGGQKNIVGGGRYVVVQPGKAEVAFVVIDQYQGQGIGSILLRHLAAIARTAGLQELIAEVLLENMPMLKVFERSGLQMTMTRESEVVHVTLRTNAETS
jgi:GNAT superfamily N-acetyltransferase